MNESIKPHNITHFKKIYTLFLITMPISNLYLSPISFIGWGEMIFFILIPAMLLDLRGKTIKKSSYWTYYFYMIFITFAVSLFTPNIEIAGVTLKLLRDTVYVLIFLFFGQIYFDFEYGIKIYKNVVIALSGFLILQVISFYIVGYTIPWVIRWLPINYGGGLTTLDYISHYQRMYSYAFRPTSIFLEPASFAQYVLPYLPLSLFPYKKEEGIKIKTALLISIAIILSRSAVGALIMVVVWGIWIIKGRKSKKPLENIAIGVVLFLAAIISLSYILVLESQFSTVLRRVTEVTTSDSSGYVRVMRGFEQWIRLPFQYKVFGIGFGNYQAFISNGYLEPLSNVADYMSGISNVLVFSGAAGLGLFTRFFIKTFRRSQATNRMLIIVILLILISSDLYSTPIYAMVMVFILKLQNITQNKNSTNLVLLKEDKNENKNYHIT